MTIKKRTGHEDGHGVAEQYEKPRKNMTARLALTVIGATMGSFQFGYSTGAINAPESLIKDFMNLTHYSREGFPMPEDTMVHLWALIVAIFSIGGCLGGLVAGMWATTFGR